MTPEAQRELLNNYCVSCHNYSDYAGGVEFEVFDPGNPHDDAKIAEKMLKKLRAGMMPPAGEQRPDFAAVAAFATSLETTIDSQAKPNLRVPKLHRLNRTEYANAVRDLLALRARLDAVPAGGRCEPRLRQPGGHARLCRRRCWRRISRRPRASAESRWARPPRRRR